MYYFWRLLGYTEEELTYISQKEVLDIVESVEQKREEKKKHDYNTRYAKAVTERSDVLKNGRLKTRFKDDLTECLKKRWKGVKGIDASIVCDVLDTH
jgi:hypothetical protein